MDFVSRTEAGKDPGECCSVGLQVGVAAGLDDVEGGVDLDQPVVTFPVQRYQIIGQERQLPLGVRGQADKQVDLIHLQLCQTANSPSEGVHGWQSAIGGKVHQHSSHCHTWSVSDHHLGHGISFEYPQNLYQSLTRVVKTWQSTSQDTCPGARDCDGVLVMTHVPTESHLDMTRT